MPSTEKNNIKKKSRFNIIDLLIIIVIIAAVAYLPFIRLSHFLLHLPGEYPKPRMAAGFFIRRQAKQPEGCHPLQLLPAAFISCASAPLCRCPDAFPAP